MTKRLTDLFFFFFSSRRRHTRFSRDWSSDVCSSDLDRDDVPRDVVLEARDHEVGGDLAVLRVQVEDPEVAAGDVLEAIHVGHELGVRPRHVGEGGAERLDLGAQLPDLLPEIGLGHGKARMRTGRLILTVPPRCRWAEPLDEVQPYCESAASSSWYRRPNVLIDSAK